MSGGRGVTAMHHEPVADRLGVPRHQLPADWRQRGGPPMGGGGTPPRRGGCLTALLIVALSATATPAGALVAGLITAWS